MASAPHEKTREQVQKDYTSKLSSIRDRRDLSDAGKRAHLAGAYQDARKELRAIQAREEQQVADRRSHLQRTLFGNPDSNSATSAVSYRDALDRVGQLKSSEEGLDLLHRATMTGDTALVRAVGLHAATKHDQAAATSSNTGWTGVLDQWVDAQLDPEKASGAIAELSDIGERNTKRAKVARKLGNTLSVPREIEGHTSDEALGRLRDLQEPKAEPSAWADW